MYTLGRPINGTSLNGVELLMEGTEPMRFKSQDAIREFCGTELNATVGDFDDGRLVICDAFGNPV